MPIFCGNVELIRCEPTLFGLLPAKVVARFYRHTNYTIITHTPKCNYVSVTIITFFTPSFHLSFPSLHLTLFTSNYPISHGLLEVKMSNIILVLNQIFTCAISVREVFVDWILVSDSTEQWGQILIVRIKYRARLWRRWTTPVNLFSHQAITILMTTRNRKICHFLRKGEANKQVAHLVVSNRSLTPAAPRMMLTRCLP